MLPLPETHIISSLEDKERKKLKRYMKKYLRIMKKTKNLDEIWGV